MFDALFVLTESWLNVKWLKTTKKETAAKQNLNPLR
jgi:hypothetical protein